MRVNIMPCARDRLSGWPNDLKAGVEKHGDTAYFTQEADDAECHAFWGLKRRHGKVALAKGLKSLIVERAYLGDRFRWRAMGFGGLNGWADFCTDDVPDDRWKKYWAKDLKEWKTGGDYALIIGQVPGDSALRGLDIYRWANRVAREALNHYDRVYFRPHPEARKDWALTHADTLSGDLSEAISGAAVVITYNSNTAVDAVMAGTPAIAMDRGSMAWSVSSHSLDEPLFRGDRSDWGRRIAYSQWLPEEVRSGEAWDHLRRFV